jgi:hypothetical protein
MSILYTINQITSSIRQFINDKQKECKEQECKEQKDIKIYKNNNIKSYSSSIVTEKQFRKNLNVGLANYSFESMTKSTTLLLQYENKFYWLNKFNKPIEKVFIELDNTNTNVPYKLLNIKHIKINENKDANKDANIYAQD